MITSSNTNNIQHSQSHKCNIYHNKQQCDNNIIEIKYRNNVSKLIELHVPNVHFHIIDHRIVFPYLILLQIRLYDQQDALLLLENNNGQCEMNDNAINLAYDTT